MRCPACHRHFTTYDDEPPDSCPYCLHEREPDKPDEPEKGASSYDSV